MRSDSFLDPEGRTVSASFAGNVKNNGVKTEATMEAFQGKSGDKIIEDYNGNRVLSSYSSLDIGDFTWALVLKSMSRKLFGGEYHSYEHLESTGYHRGTYCWLCYLPREYH